MIDQYPPANGVLTSLIWRKTAAGGETSLSGYDNASQALSYTPGQEQVYLNGILLVRGDDYTATNGTSITGLAALSASDFVQVNCYNNFSVATLPTSGLTGTIANNQLQNSSITINGSAVSLGGSTTIAGGSAQDSEPTSPTEGQLWLDTNGTLATTEFVEKSTINAKGDLYVGTANDTVEILSTTENGATLVADSSATTGLRWQGDYAAGKNKIINGDFAINQRAFTTSTTTFAYGFDRWNAALTDGTTNEYSAQTFTPGAAPVAGYESENFARLISAGQTATNAQTSLRQSIEDVRTFAGQTVTFSFYAKANSGTPSIALEIGQVFGSGGSASVTTFAGKVTISTSWARYSMTVNIPSISGKTIGPSSSTTAVFFVSAGTDFNARTSSLGIQSNTFDIWGVQAETGSVATAFQTATGTLAGELAACQRYFIKMWGGGTPAYNSFGSGFNSGTTSGYYHIRFPVVLRTVPTLGTSGTASHYRLMSTTANVATSLPTQFHPGNQSTTISIGSTGLVSNAGSILDGNNNTDVFLSFSAEL